MDSALYAIVRVFLLAFGWLVALVVALVAEYTLPGSKWPIFLTFGAWWTFACTTFVRGEMADAADPDEHMMIESARSAKAALERE